MKLKTSTLYLFLAGYYAYFAIDELRADAALDLATKRGASYALGYCEGYDAGAAAARQP